MGYGRLCVPRKVNSLPRTESGHWGRVGERASHALGFALSSSRPVRMPDKSLKARKVQSRSAAKDVNDPNGSSSVSVTNVDTSAKPNKTLTWLEIPDWQKDNEYILSGYRSSHGRCLASTQHSSLLRIMR
ncbi:hypothetical protein C8Q79DRAFT_224716 [Trametes meyenii]|nr:hypothetical protein C8Q79DRAFT_224716 [Trametes meyenii]